MDLNQPTFGQEDLYQQDALNAVVTAYAQNDDRLKDIVDALYRFYVSSPTTPPDQIRSAAQLQTEINTIYDLGDVAARVTPLAPMALPRYYQELLNVLKVQPFSDLLAGVAIDPSSWVQTLRIFTMLKGLLYWVYDGPNYEVNPVYVKEGQYYFTTISNAAGNYLMVDSTGKPLLVNGVEVYKPMLLGFTPISLLMFWLKRLEVQKLRTLYRISAFEAGIDAKYSNDASYNFLDQAFVFDQLSPVVSGQQTKRFPCGFTQAGAFRFLRTDAPVFAPGADLSQLIPASGATGAGIEDRVVMDESFVQTPFGLIRIPQTILSWGSLLTPSDRLPDPVLGDPVVAIGLHVSVAIRESESTQVTGEALPASVTGNGFDGVTLVPLVKGTAPAFTNVPPLSGTQQVHEAVLGAPGHQHGLILGFIQRNSTGPTSIPQFAQVQVSLVVQRLAAGTLVQDLLALSGTRDEVAGVNTNSSGLDTTPFRTLGITPTDALHLFTGLSSFTMDPDQGILRKLTTAVAGPVRTKTFEVVLPLALNLLKNSSPYSPTNLNGCVPAFADAWAIRKVSSVQAHMGTIIFDDGTGHPEVFPEDFIGAKVTFLPAGGVPIVGTIQGKIGDKLAKLPAGVAAKMTAGDVVVIDQRVPEASLDGVYRNEVAGQSLVDLRLQVTRLVDTVVEEPPGFSPSPSPSNPIQDALVRTKTRALADAAVGTSYQTMTAAIESKLRYNVMQLAIFKAANRYDQYNLRVGVDDLQAFLIDYVKNYDANSPHHYTIGENVIVHWPSKQAVTPVSLGRYPVTRILDQQDTLTVENLPGWGDVPVLTKLFRGEDYTRYPILFNVGLPFTSDKSLAISGHNKLSGTFFLRQSQTQIYANTVHVTVYQTQIINGVSKQIFLGSVDFDHRYADSFTNATGIITIDDTSRYDPLTQRLQVAYNQTINFSLTEPGSVTLATSYHDLSQVHPLWHWSPSDYGLEVSHMATASPLQIQNGTIGPVAGSPALHLRLEGISNNGGQMTLRWNRDDAFGVVALGNNGLISTKWVVRGLPFVIIDSVTYNSVGEPTAVAYRALWVDRNQTITSQINTDNRCLQTYTPCALKYAWVDITQSNIQTEAVPIAPGNRFGFYQLTNFLDTSGALLYGSAATTIFFMMKRDPLDYRFTQVFDTTSGTGIQALTSLAVLFNPKTGERRAVTGIYATGINAGATIELNDELTLATYATQHTLYIRKHDLTADWVLDFAGLLVTVVDRAGAVFPHKLGAIGYWYGGHDLTSRSAMTTLYGPDALAFSTDQIVKSTTNWRIGDLPGRSLYLDNNLLFAERDRP